MSTFEENMSNLQRQIYTPMEGHQPPIEMLWKHLNERKKNIDDLNPAEGDSIEKLTTESAAAADDPWAFLKNMPKKGGRRRKSSSGRGRSSTKKRGTQRKQKRRQRRASRRAY